MLAPRVGQVVLGELVEELDIARQAHSHVRALDQVVAEQPLFGESTCQHAAEGPHVVDALAVVGAFAREVLVDVGHGPCVGVDSHRVGEQPAERRGARAGQRGAHAGLDDRVRPGEHPAFPVEAGLVERVRQGLDDSAGGPRGKLGIGVQRDDEPDIRQVLCLSDVDEPTGAVGPRPVNQAVELFQLPALSLPPDVFLLGFTPYPFPVEQEEARTTVALVEGLQPGYCSPEQPVVFFTVSVVRVGVVREKAEQQVVFPVRQEADFQLLHLRPDCREVLEQHRNDHEGPTRVRNSRRLEIHLGEGSRRKHTHDEVVHDLDGDLAGGDQREK